MPLHATLVTYYTFLNLIQKHMHLLISFCHTISVKKNYTEFFREFIANFVKYTKQHVVKGWPCKYGTSIEHLLNKNTLALHVEYINDPIVKRYHETSSPCKTQGKFSFFIGIDKQKPASQTLTMLGAWQNKYKKREAE